MENNYYVIGGQYAVYCHGGTDTLPEAKRLAESSTEFHDNWAGWVVPDVYKAEDTELCQNFYGTMRCPRDGAVPVAVAEFDGHGKIRWRKWTQWF